MAATNNKLIASRVIYPLCILALGAAGIMKSPTGRDGSCGECSGFMASFMSCVAAAIAIGTAHAAIRDGIKHRRWLREHS